jgi:hypothetical protein
MRFEDFIAPWPTVRNPDGAARAYVDCVTVADEEAAFAARDRYLASDEVSRGVITGVERWLYDQRKSGWTGKWAAPISSKPTAKETRAAGIRSAFPELEDGYEEPGRKAN